MSKRNRSGKPRPIDPHEVDMPQLFGDLVRERSLFGVLRALAEACRTRASHYIEQLAEKDLHPVIKVDWEDEIEFFEEAADDIDLIEGMIRSDWQGRDLPTCADGSFRMISRRAVEAGRKYLIDLIGTIADPDASQEERAKAMQELASDAQGFWYDRRTGKPGFELSKWWEEATQKLIDPKVSAEEKAQTIEQLHEFVFWLEDTAKGENQAEA